MGPAGRGPDRQDHGEQPIWLGVTLAAMLGQIGLPGGGFQHGYGSAADVGLAINPDGVANQLEGGATQATSWTSITRSLEVALP